jgi:hypothetical protein
VGCDVGRDAEDRAGEDLVTLVVHIKDGYDVYIGRAGKGQDGYFGNPFPLEREAQRSLVLAKYRDYFQARITSDPEFKRRVEELKGKRLGCFCAPKHRCHGDTIAEYLNTLTDETKP